MTGLSVVAFVALAAIGAYAPQQSGSEPLSPELEARVQKLGSELRCTVCQGLAIADSPSSMARAQLDKVRELVAAGKTDQEVRDYFVARYGEWTLLEPKAQGLNLVVWLGPIVLIGVGLIVVLYQALARSPRAERPKEPPPSAPGASDDDYVRAIRSEADR